MQAPTRLRVAFVGKGGAGKSSIAGTFARLLCRRSEPVLALDSDPMPGLPYALGIPVEDHPIPDDVVVEGAEGEARWLLRPGLDAATFVEQYATPAPDGVLYLQFGNLWGHIAALGRAQHAWSQVVRELEREAYHLVGDVPGGTRQAMFGWARYADVVIVVVEPTVKSLHSAARLLHLDKASWGPTELLLVANKVDHPRDVARMQQRLGRTVLAVVPHDPAVLAADRRAVAPLDGAPDGPFVGAIDALASTVVGLYPLVREVTP